MDLDKPLNNFETNLRKVDELVGIGSEVGNISVQLLEKLLEDHQKYPAFEVYKSKLATTIGIIKDIKRHGALEPSYKAVYAQSLVLVVSNFESFLNELVILLFNHYPYLIKWPEKKLSLDLSVFEYTVPSTGELILRSVKERYSFQDLKSILDFLKDYLEIDISLNDKLLDSIVLHHAQRHAIIHNLGKADEKYLKQIRHTSYANYIKMGKEIVVTEEEYQSARSCFKKFASIIYENVKTKFVETPPF